MTCGSLGGKKANGDPCGREVRAGFTRCNMHGGATPAAKIKAEQALALARMPAIESLHTILDQFSSQTCGACGFPKGDAEEKRVVISAARAVLDRTGMGPQSVVELTAQSDGAIDVALLTEEERARLLAALAEIKDIKASVRLRQMGETPAGFAPATTERIM